MSQTVLFSVTLDAQSQYYGTLKIANIHYGDKAPVPIQKFLGITLQSPASISASDVVFSSTPWFDTSVEIKNSQISTDKYNVQIQVNFSEAFSVDTGVSITIGVNGDLTSDPGSWSSSVSLLADELPSSSALFQPHPSLHSPSAVAWLVSQPASLTNFIGGMIRKGFGCCFGRDDSLDEKLPGEITLKC